MSKAIDDGLTNMQRYKRRQPERVKKSARRFRIKHRDRIALWRRNYNLIHITETRARHAVSNAVRDGRLAKANTLPCRCGKAAQQYHHPDYSKPLEVIALCRRCHLQEIR